MTSLHVIRGLPLPLYQKSWLRQWLQWLITTGYSHIDVIGQFYVRLFFGLVLVLIIIRTGAKYWL